ncbi:caspase, EACC1-associated type [Nodularia sp. UHCC 0506]|uniref:caspase, EACC1-associated type n=1 Tax=Nodularia sp. UHCC 0506 TaxID=3110243 RepID=UPI002B1F9EFB|nr:SUMF1/EgtB/PvdO family nonheme iron enzyme [Nodularia sp. UHCC 0506]MEA5515307.1 SUMF1/EgtB/PvdO family nonheme iron enzyme [Nodularia sp. UHCC 0506]
MAKKIALLIGISEYQPGLARLPNAVNDVEAMQRVLVDSERGGFAEGDVTVLKNPQRQDMENAIYHLYANRQKDDLVLFYFSGHGVTVENGDFYFSTSITQKNQGKLVLPTAVAAKSVHDWMNQSKSKRLVVILDCCFSGAFAKGLTAKDSGAIDLQQYLGGEGRAILTASTSTQYAFESDGLDLSIYTHYLVEGISTGAADQDGDGLIAVDELHQYAKSKVQEASPAMTPELYPHKDGYRIFLAKSPKDDPKLKYRQEFDIIAFEDEGEISEINRFYLDELWNQLGLTLDEANGIEFEVLEPYRKRQEKLQRYEQALQQITEYPLSNKHRKSLKRLQNILNLRDQDIKTIEQRVLAPKEAKYQIQQKEAQRLRQEKQERTEYEAKLYRYEQELSQAVKVGYPPDEFVRNGLKKFQQDLGLKNEDVASIEQRIFAPKQVEYERQQQEEQRLREKEQQERIEYQRQQEEKLRRQQAERLLQKQRERESSKPPSPASIQTQPFEFETATITVTSQGFLGIGKSYDINRRRGRAEFFTEDLGNGVVIDMVAIPGGTFLMGSPENEPKRRDSESPQHSVTIQPFFMGKFPVTQAQWAAVAAFDKVKIDLKSDPSCFKGANRPVEYVSWNDAVEFCARLSQKTGKTYRLPSEAEWEYACRAGTTTPFYFGETITTDLANYDGKSTYGSAPKGEYRGQTTDVGKFPANPFGLYDMCGNIWEWCQDEWHKNYNNAPADGSAWLIDNQKRMLRGGSWFNNPAICRSACRDYGLAGNSNFNVGFRVACAAAWTQ